jgi:tetratricopeptide (TPR) repeat protein
MRTKFSVAGVGFFAALLAVASLNAQMPDRAIDGFVRVQGSMTPPPGTVVTLQLVGGGTEEQVVPGGNGRFTFASLSSANYYVVAKAPGYRDATQRVNLVDNRRFTVTLTMVPEPGKAPPQPVEGLITRREAAIPKDARKEYEHASDLVRKRKLPEALSHLEKAVHLYPDYYEAYELMGTVYMDEQKWSDAEQALKRSIEVDAEYAPAYVALGATYNRQGKFADALPLLEKAEKLDPDSWLCHLELAQSLLPQGKVEEAEPHARLAHEKNPQFPLVHLALANVALAKGDLKLAREECEHFLKLVPEGPLAQMVKNKAQEIDSALAQQQSAKP